MHKKNYNLEIRKGIWLLFSYISTRITCHLPIFTIVILLKRDSGTGGFLWLIFANLTGFLDT